jgi:hypothetical protein
MFHRRSIRLGAACVTGCAIAIGALALDAQPTDPWSRAGARASAPPSGDVCSQLPGLSATGLLAGDTNGDFGTLAAGESVTMTATLGTAGSGSFRIVGDPGGVDTLAGPASIPGTLTFVSNGALPGGSVGVGYFIDTAAGGTVDIAVKSSCVPAQVPATSVSTLALIAALITLGAGTVLVVRRN